MHSGAEEITKLRSLHFTFANSQASHSVSSCQKRVEGQGKGIEEGQNSCCSIFLPFSPYFPLTLACSFVSELSS